MQGQETRVVLSPRALQGRKRERRELQHSLLSTLEERGTVMVIPSSPSPTPTLALALNSKLSSPESLLEYARSLLRTKDTPSLAILLFLLDALTFLHSASKSDSASDSEDRVGGESSSQFPSSSSSSTPATAEETWEEWSDYISEVVRVSISIINSLARWETEPHPRVVLAPFRR